MSDVNDLVKDSDFRELLVFEKLLKIRDTRIQFAKKYHKNTKGERMNFDLIPHMHQIYNTLAKEFVIQGSVQSFKTEFMVIDTFASCASGLSIFYVLPKYEARNTFVQNRIDKAIAMSPQYKKLRAEGHFDNVAMKSLGKGVIKFVGSNVISDFREFPADLLAVDELDECDQLNLRYASDRLEASRFKFKRAVANPKEPDKGINAMLKDSTYFEWWNYCQECGDPVKTDWFDTVVDMKLDINGAPIGFDLKDQDWKEGEKLWTICPKCGSRYDHYTGGFWNARNPEALVEGYHLHLMLSPFKPLAELYYEFRKAIESPEALNHFFSSCLGLPYTGWGMQITTDLLRACADPKLKFSSVDKTSYIPPNSLNPAFACSMGVDVGSAFDVRISQVTDEGKRIAVFMGKVYDMKDLLDLGGQYGVECAVIDAAPEARIAQDFQDQAPFDVWLCRYSGEGTDKVQSKNKKDKVLSVDRTTILDKTFSELKRRNNILPVNFDKIMEEEYLEEMKVSVRQSVTDGKGNTKYVWSKEKKDHQRHADVYDYLASRQVVSSCSALQIEVL